MSMMAAAHIVELLVTLLQHPLQAAAPAHPSNNFQAEDQEGVLGPVPHSIRFVYVNLKSIVFSFHQFFLY